MPFETREYRGNGLSKFRTFHRVPLYAEIKSPDQAVEAFIYARERGLSPFVLGAGSNVFFKNSRVKSLVLKTALPPEIRDMGNGAFEVSASATMADLLKRLYREGRDGPYYLASAPCQIGGAVAMNAGSGPREGKSISDFLKSVTLADADGIRTISKGELEPSYRRTRLLERRAFIVSAVFEFPERRFDCDPIKERMEWAVRHQDLSAPNCGSVCNKYDARIMRFTRLLFRPFKAGMSAKKLNWAYNRAKGPATLKAFFWVLKFLHKLFGKELKFEIRMVD